MVTENISQEIIKIQPLINLTITTVITASISVVSVIALIKWFGKKTVVHLFDKNLEKFKSELNLLTENKKYEYQKNLADFNHFISKKHEVLREVYSLSVKAGGIVRSLDGSKFLPTFENSGVADLVDYLNERGVFSKLDIEELTELFKISRQKAMAKIHERLWYTHTMDAGALHRDAINYYWTNIVYIPKHISDEIEKYLSKVNDLVIFSQVKNITIEAAQQKTIIIRETIELEKNLIEVFRKELSQTD